MSDPYYDNTVLALTFEPLEGVPGVNQLYDYSKYHRGVTLNGPTSLSDTSKYGSKSLSLINDNTSYVMVLNPADFVFGTGDFTVECWIKKSSANGSIIDFYTSNSWVWQVATNKLQWVKSVGTVVKTGSATINTDAWVHIAATRASGQLSFWVNGGQDGTPTADSTDYSGNAAYLGLGGFLFASSQGELLDEARITNGVARYTDTFTPASWAADYPAPAGFTPRQIPQEFNYSPLQWSSLPNYAKQIEQENHVLHNYAHTIWGGNGTVSGTVKVGSTFLKRKVRLYEASTGLFIREQWSNPDGTYVFTGLKKDYQYTVTATDYANTYNDVIAARVTAI